MTVAFVVFSALYSFLLLAAIRVWKALIQKKPSRPPEASENYFSIIVPVRNESDNILKLLLSLSRQTCPKEKFEVLVIDDHSEDDTLQVVENWSKNGDFTIRLFSLNKVNGNQGNKLYGKKQALTLGIDNARGNIIVTTDGDCMMSERWLDSIAYSFKAPIKMLLGPVTYFDESSWFEHFQTLELAALIGVGAVSLKSGSPNMCNGANLAFTREVFSEVGGYTGNLEVASGDDEFLMHKIHEKYPDKVHFNTHADGTVLTKAIPDLPTFVQQRKRWAGKWRIHKSHSVKLLAIFVFSFHAMAAGVIIAALWGHMSAPVIAGCWLLKAYLEYLFIGSVLRHFQKKISFKHFVVLQGIYSFYVIVFGVIANFGSFDWKGRKY